MLHFEGDVENTFMQTFRISYTDVFGATLSYDLKDNGDDIRVTKENRQVIITLKKVMNSSCMFCSSTVEHKNTIFFTGIRELVFRLPLEQVN